MKKESMMSVVEGRMSGSGPATPVLFAKAELFTISSKLDS
jgi:hypothetical protein